MSHPALMKEARELIAFYDERGWDWTSVLGFIICRSLYGKDFTIGSRHEGYYVIRRKYKELVQP